MTVTPPPQPVVTPAPAPVEEDIHPIFMLEGAFPVFMPKTDKEMKEIREAKIPFCFILTTIKVPDPNDPKKPVVPRTAMLKMINTPFGYSLTEVTLNSLERKAEGKLGSMYNLPKIPWQMVERMDKFFRAVFAKHGTEGSVLLTYDTEFLDKEDPLEGWDFYVPSQTNSHSACDYEKSEVLSALAGTTKILAGSVHSHPEMKAYASGTDHKDQANWDGIHITYGWLKGEKHSHYHAAMIIGSMEWVINPEEVMEPPPAPEVDFTSLETLVEKVSKYVPPTTTYTGHGSGQYQGGRSPAGQSGDVKSYKTNHTGPLAKRATIFLPKDAPDPVNNVVVVLRRADEDSCRFCDAVITAQMEKRHRCYNCDGFFINEGEKVFDLNEMRKDLPNAEFCDELDPEKAKHNIYLWALEDPPEGTKKKTALDVFYEVLSVENGVPTPK